VTEQAESHFDVFRQAKRTAHDAAISELTTVSIVTGVPFTVGLISFLISKDSPNLTLTAYMNLGGSYLSSVFLQGQLFLIAVSFLATALHRLWNSDQSYRRPDMINIFAILFFGVVGIFYGNNPEFTSTTSPLARGISVAFMLLSILFYYYTAVLAYDRPKPVEQVLQNTAKRLRGKVETRRAAAVAARAE